MVACRQLGHQPRAVQGLLPRLGRGASRRYPRCDRDDSLPLRRRLRKTSRRSHYHRKGGKPLHLVSVWATGQRIVLEQQATEEKSNEITAIPLLLRALDLTGALVTIDAMGTQTRIAEAIRDGGGNYVLALKENWPATLAEVETLFDKPPPGMAFETHQTVDGCNGRITTRRHSVCYQVDWMTAGWRYPGEPRFPDLTMIGRIDSDVERAGKVEHEKRYYMASTKLSAEMFGHAVRAHWGDREPPALGARCGVPRGSREAAQRKRTRKHGDRPPYRAQPAVQGQTHNQLQGPP
jgi:predicted transposase YbfD/YdcC